MSASAAKEAVHVSLCSNVLGLRGAVEAAFASSALASRYELRLQDLAAQGDEAEAEILLADPGKVKDLLDSVRGLRWLQSTWAGVNALEGVKRRDFTCTRHGGYFGQQMSEYVFGAIFYEDWRSLAGHQARGEWAPEAFRKRRRLSSLALGLLGAGDIPRAIGLRARAFGMRTLALASSARESADFDVVTADLDLVLGEADVVVNVLPSTPATRGLLDGGRLAACGQGKLLVNVGRGDVVSEAGLLEALQKGWLRRAVLDVFAAEPLPASSELWGHPQVQLSPHIAAVTYAEDTAELFVENLALWLEGRPLRFVVDLDRGY